MFQRLVLVLASLAVALPALGKQRFPEDEVPLVMPVGKGSYASRAARDEQGGQPRRADANPPLVSPAL